MREPVEIELQPLGQSISVEPGTSLQDVLHGYGVEFPCGGNGRCGGCRIKLLAGTLAVTPPQAQILSASEIEQGWRLACHCRVDGCLTLEVEQWDTAILTHHASLQFAPRPGRGIVVDLGTTTLVAQLLDLQSGRVLAVQKARNPQAVRGADVMSRLARALEPGGRQELADLIRNEIGALLVGMLDSAPNAEKAIESVVVVGNTVMHHLFCDLDIESLAYSPFDSPNDGLQEFTAEQLGWRLPGSPRVRFLPGLGGFVGADILAGVLATSMHESDEVVALIDLGTNGEIAAGNRERILCTSTAAGPAFEGGRISQGMQASTGAIAEVRAEGGGLACHVIGGGKARGVCGSGLVDAVATSLDMRLIRPNGRLADGSHSLPLTNDICLTQSDIRELQLAKGAISAGLRILLARLGTDEEQLAKLYLAGAFGNYVNPASARRIGLFSARAERVEAAGNTALLGAKLALFGEGFADMRFADLLSRIEHVPLATDARFQEVFIAETAFPGPQ